LLARLTSPHGGDAPGIGFTSIDSPVAQGVSPGQPSSVADQLDRRVAHLQRGSLHQLVMRAAWAKALFGGAEATAAAREALALAPMSPLLKWELAVCQWSDGHADEASTLLSDLHRHDGADLPYLSVKQARFWRFQGLKRSARDVLVSLWAKHT